MGFFRKLIGQKGLAKNTMGLADPRPGASVISDSVDAIRRGRENQKNNPRVRIENLTDSQRSDCANKALVGAVSWFLLAVGWTLIGLKSFTTGYSTWAEFYAVGVGISLFVSFCQTYEYDIIRRGESIPFGQWVIEIFYCQKS